MRARDFRRKIHKIIDLEEGARSRYTYFLIGNSRDGYNWELVDIRDETIALSPIYKTRKDCLKSLKATQRHASSKAVRDDAR
jgi:uncharacterized protein YegP (UPF0339 family)